MELVFSAWSRYLPIKSNRDLWRLEREICDAIMKIIKDHDCENSEEENDLLKVLVKNFGSENCDNLIIENCKAIYFAGHETTATAATFILILLAYHQEWQKQVREEVAEVCSGQVPTADMLHKMKKVRLKNLVGSEQSISHCQQRFVASLDTLRFLKLSELFWLQISRNKTMSTVCPKQTISGNGSRCFMHTSFLI